MAILLHRMRKVYVYVYNDHASEHLAQTEMADLAARNACITILQIHKTSSALQTERKSEFTQSCV